jgi:hypothetical protein
VNNVNVMYEFVENWQITIDCQILAVPLLIF